MQYSRLYYRKLSIDENNVIHSPAQAVDNTIYLFTFLIYHLSKALSQIIRFITAQDFTENRC